MYIFFKRLHLNYKEKNLLKHSKRYRLFIRHTSMGKYFVDYQKSFQILKEIGNAISKGELEYPDKDVLCQAEWSNGIDYDMTMIIDFKHKLKRQEFIKEDDKNIEAFYFPRWKNGLESISCCFIKSSLTCIVSRCMRYSYDSKYNIWLDCWKASNDREYVWVLDFSEYNLKQ